MRNAVSVMVVGACLVWITLLSGCATAPPASAPPASAPPAVNMPAPFTDHGVTVTVEGLWRNGDGVVGVSGTATNTGSAPLIGCTINLDVVDSSGVKVSDALASTQSLQPGQTWRFQAVFMSPFSVSFSSIRPGKITAFAQPAPRQADVSAKPLRFGAYFKPIPDGLASVLKVPAGEGVVVVSVANPSPAFAAGLTAGDVVVRFDGQLITNTEQLAAAVRVHPSGQQATVDIFRRGSPKTLIAPM
jgi:hypothetical protein